MPSNNAQSTLVGVHVRGTVRAEGPNVSRLDLPSDTPKGVPKVPKVPQLGKNKRI